MQASGNSLD